MILKMTFKEFKKNAFKLGWILTSNPPDDDMKVLYASWTVKTWCSSLKTIYIIWTRENEFLNFRDLSVKDIEDIHKMNGVLFKEYKVQQKLKEIQEDFL